MAILQSKKVSVVVPNYNYAKYIARRLDSIARQTYPIYELIVLDDASTDGSVEIIKKAMAKAGRKKPGMKMRLIRNKDNSGKAICQWLKGMKEARGDFVWIAEADDLSSKHFLEEAMRGFDDSEVVLSYTESMIINGAGVMIAPNFRWSRDKEKTGHFKKSYIKDGRDEICEIMAIRCTIPNVSGVVFRKSAVNKKDFEKALEFTQAGDWYLYAKVLENGRVAYNRKSLNRFRIHAGSKTMESKKEASHYNEILKMHRMFKERYDLSKEILDKMQKEELRTKNKHDIMR